MTIREKVARAICEADMVAPEPNAPIFIGIKTARAWQGRTEMATAAIKAFLAAAADQGWHMRPDEATQEMMGAAGKIVEGGEYILGVEVYPAMLAAAPKFEPDK